MPLFGKIKHTYGRESRKNISYKKRKKSNFDSIVKNNSNMKLESPKLKQISLSETPFSDSIWKDSFDKILDGKTPLRKCNILKSDVRVSYNMDSSVENNSDLNCDNSIIASPLIKNKAYTNLNLKVKSTYNASTPIGIRKSPCRSINVSPINNLLTIEPKEISSLFYNSQESTKYIKLDCDNNTINRITNNSPEIFSIISIQDSPICKVNFSKNNVLSETSDLINTLNQPNAIINKSSLSKTPTDYIVIEDINKTQSSISSEIIEIKEKPKLVENITLRRSQRFKENNIFKKHKKLTIISPSKKKIKLKNVTKKRGGSKLSICIIEMTPEVENIRKKFRRIKGKSLFSENNIEESLDVKKCILKPGKWRQSLAIFRRASSIKIIPSLNESLDSSHCDKNKFINLKNNRKSCRIIAVPVNCDNERGNIDNIVKKFNESLANCSLVFEPTDDEVCNLSSASFSLCDESATTAIRKTRSAKNKACNISSYSTGILSTEQGNNRTCEIVELCTKFNDSDIFQRSLSLCVSDKTRELSIKEIIVSRARSSTDCSVLQQQSEEGGESGKNNCPEQQQLQLYKKKQSLFKNRKTSFIESPTTPIRLVTFGDICFNKEHLVDLVPKLSTREIVLRRCGQAEPIGFNDIYSESALRQCRKIGEGVYGEVFMNKTQSGKAVVLKIIPIEGNIEINGESQKKFDEIISEIIIAMELSSLRNEKNNSFMTSGFVEVVQVRCVQGSYPEHLIDLWELYRDNCGTENDHPEIFPDDQLYIVLELANAGQDLEAFNFTNALQSYSAFVQTALTLAVAEEQFKFEHRDLHWGNILISTTDDTNAIYKLNGNVIKIPTHGVKVTIIDYTLSRMIFDGCCLYNDLSNDNELFSASGDYQFDIYRFMKDRLDNSWEAYEPYTNILWLHYTIDKMINGARYRNTKSKKHRTAIHDMMLLRDELLDFKSASDYVKNI